MTEMYLWRVYCITEGQYVSTVSATEPTTCPNNPLHTIDSNLTAVMESQFYNIYSDGYINIQSGLADNQAIKIRASDTNGGIDIDAGFGGITVDTTNSISLDAAAASNFTTTMGNLTLEATAGLVTIDGGSGLNIGNASATTPIYIGTSAFTKDVEIGNNTGSTLLALRSGTGGISINSAKTASNAIDIFSSGGIAANASGLINIASANNTVSAITLDASSGGGGMVLTSGAQGIILTSNGGPLALGSWSGGDLYLGTAAVSRSITIGNITGTTALVLNAGTGGIAIGNDSSTGEIQIGNTANDKTIIMGNNNANTRIFQRFGTAGIVRHQEAETSLSDANATLTISDILKTIFAITPTTGRTLTLPTAANAVAGISGVQVNDSVDFTIINQSTAANAAHLTIANNTGVTIVGNTDIAPISNLLATFYTSGSGTYRIRFTNVGSGTEAYTAYRLC